MTQISAKEVMKLRSRTGLSMMECKKALAEVGGDIDEAESLLRKKLKGKMETRTDRAAGEGRIAVAVAPDNSGAAIVEIRAETDFTARNDKFVEVAQTAADRALEQPAGDVDATDEINALIDDLRISTGENCSLARAVKLDGGDGAAFGSYVHHDGKTGVLIKTSGGLDEKTMRQVCMHITAAVPRPLGITPDEIPADVVEKERKFRTEQAMESGKPKEIAEKIVEGGMRKFFEEVALLEQPFVMDQSLKIKDIVGDAKILSFTRWQVGETAGD